MCACRHTFRPTRSYKHVYNEPHDQRRPMHGRSITVRGQLLLDECSRSIGLVMTRCETESSSTFDVTQTGYQITIYYDFRLFFFIHRTAFIKPVFYVFPFYFSVRCALYFALVCIFLNVKNLVCVKRCASLGLTVLLQWLQDNHAVPHAVVQCNHDPYFEIIIYNHCVNTVTEDK